MGATYRLPEEMRPKLAKPLGRLFDADELKSQAFSKLIGEVSLVVSVGDRVTETIGGMGRVPEVQVVDSRENRKNREPPNVPHARTIRVRNPAGTITQEAIDGIRDALRGEKPARVLVEGEEDLLAIPAVVFAPVSSAVFYGQPGKGIVMVRVTSGSKARNRALLSAMGSADVR